MFSTDATGRMGVHRVAIALAELGWFFREQPISDFGIDAHAASPDRYGRPSGRLIALQIKAGRSWFREQVQGGVVYRGSLEHLEYWRAHSVPVAVVLRDLENKTCIWQLVKPEHVEPTAKARRLIVPFNLRTAVNR